MPDPASPSEPGAPPAPSRRLEISVVDFVSPVTVADRTASVRVWFSSRPFVSKYHMDRTCPGLEHVDDEGRATRRFSSTLALLRTEAGRPCRLCTFEPALAAALDSPWLTGGPRVVVEFSGQPNPLEAGARRYRYTAVSESGAARLHRLADRLGLATADTAAGPVAYGTISRRLATVLARNLRLVVHPDAPAGTLPDPLEVAVRWTLLNEDPPELHAQDGSQPALDPWIVARAVVA